MLEAWPRRSCPQVHALHLEVVSQAARRARREMHLERSTFRLDDLERLHHLVIRGHQHSGHLRPYGLERLPVVVVDGLDVQLEIRRLAHAKNKILAFASLASWRHCLSSRTQLEAREERALRRQGSRSRAI